MKERDTYKPSEWFDGERWRTWLIDQKNYVWGKLYESDTIEPTKEKLFLNGSKHKIRADIGQTQSGLRWWRPWLWGEPKGMKLICKDREMSIDEVKHVVEYGIVGIVRRAEYEAYPEKLDAPVEDV